MKFDIENSIALYLERKISTIIAENGAALLKYPKLIDCIILARSKRKDIDWMITAENKDYADNKVEYICRWLNHSFRPFTKKQAELCEKIKVNYNKMLNN